jgi:hypothetical protein
MTTRLGAKFAECSFDEVRRITLLRGWVNKPSFKVCPALPSLPILRAYVRVAFFSARRL